MTDIRDKQLEAKIQNRMERLEISNFEIPELKEGCYYLSKVLYELLNDESTKDILEAQEKVAKIEKVPLYELQADIGAVINVVNEEVLKSFYKAKDYNLKLMYDTIQLIADDILMRD